ncbi:hypothetical protein MASR2M48_24570 [Spirochaetota bacterium]
MEDRELYQKLLGISQPWNVKNVELNASEGKVTVTLDHDKGTKLSALNAITKALYMITGNVSGGILILVGLSRLLKPMYPESSAQNIKYGKFPFHGLKQEVGSPQCSKP